MELKTAVTSIHDRNGRRVGSYLVEASRDSLNRERNQGRPRNQDEEVDAVVFHRQTADSDKGTVDSVTPPKRDDSSLDVTV